MKQEVSVSPPLAFLTTQMLGNVLSTTDVPPERNFREISVLTLPLQHVNHLENFAGCFGDGWLDLQSKTLRLQFQLVSVFGNAKVNDLWLSVPGSDTRIALAPTCLASPDSGQRQAGISWAEQSRFVFDEFISLPDWAIDSTQLNLVAGVDGAQEQLGIIYVGDTIRCHSRHDNLPEIASPAPVVTQEIAEMNNKDIPEATQGIVDRIRQIDRLFLLTVALPTLISIIYFGFIASDVYISESRFVVRSPQHQSGMGLSSLLQGSGFSHTEDDSYAVHDYIFSRDALKQLDIQFNLAKEFSSGKVDIFSRFSGLDWDDSFEALYVYYQKHVVLDLDTSSSISTLSVKGYSADTAYQINEKLLQMSEALVNQLNERGRLDMLNFANREVAEAERKDKGATLALARIQTESGKIAEGGRSLASRFTEVQRLTLEKEFADKMLAMAMNSLETARDEALRKQLYLERIAQPSKPDVAVEPRRIRNVLITFVLGLITWGILSMLLAGVREHQD